MIIAELLWTLVIVFAVLGATGLWLTLYNTLVALRNDVGRGWANIDVLLKQRHDELPKLVQVCEAYMRHERAIFDRLSDARAALHQARGVAARAEAESLLGRALGQIFAVAEAYPDLQANGSFRQLQTRVSEIEDQIADRRELYNATATRFNTRLEQLPDRWVAAWLDLRPAELFRIPEAERQAVPLRFAAAS